MDDDSISRGVFEGTINYDCIFTATSGDDMHARFEIQLEGPLPRP